MRVITGSAKGARLASLSGNDVRPTAERVKEAVFSIIQFDIEGRRVLDLFGGSGQMGIEALSRGAESAVFLDSSAESVNVINRNLKVTGLLDKAQVVKRDYKMYLDGTSDVFDIAFIDPPYYAGFYESALTLTAKRMSDYGVMFCEHPSDVSVPTNVGGFTAVKDYRYGKIFITVYRREENVQ